MAYAYFNDEIVPEEEANINLKTNSFHYGTVVFEGIRAYYNKEKDKMFILFAKEHYERLLKSAEGLFMNVNYSADELVNITKELLRKSEVSQDFYIRPVIYFKDLKIVPKLEGYEAGLAILLYPFGKYLDTASGISAKVSSWRRNSDNSIPARWKVAGAYVNGALAKTEAIQDGYNEAILLNQKGSVSEGSGENIFLVRNNKLITPSLSSDILEGITRQAIIQIAKDKKIAQVEEREIARSELYLSDEIFFCGTAAEITPVISVDGRNVGNGGIGDITKKMQEVYFDAVMGKIEEYEEWIAEV